MLKLNVVRSIWYLGTVFCSVPALASTVPITFNTYITFSELPLYTYVDQQYSKSGIVFGGDSPFITTDTSNPTSPVLSGSPRFFGSIKGSFVDSNTGAPVGRRQFRLDAGYFDATGSTVLTWFNKAGAAIGSQSNKAKGIYTFNISATQDIYSWQIKSVGTEPSGFAIDNVAFNAGSAPCGDIRDVIIKEYSTYHVSLMPICSDFTQTAHSAYYSFANLNTANFTWALIRSPLTASYPSPGLDAWVVYTGSIHQINSAYRNPSRNSAAGGKPESRHQYGDAVDIKNNTQTLKEYKALSQAALVAGADYIEDAYGKQGPCKLKCVHADWRNYIGPYEK